MLRQNNLLHELPATLGHLPQLKSINLKKNSITALPLGFGVLRAKGCNFMQLDQSLNPNGLRLVAPVAPREQILTITKLDLSGKNIGVVGGMVLAGLVPVAASLTSVSCRT